MNLTYYLLSRVLLLHEPQLLGHPPLLALQPPLPRLLLPLPLLLLPQPLLRAQPLEVGLGQVGGVEVKVLRSNCFGNEKEK